MGYQYNYKSTGSTNVFDMDSQNINVNDRFDGWRTMYYADLLGAPTERICAPAPRSTSTRAAAAPTPKLNFSTGNANYIGVPWVYID